MELCLHSSAALLSWISAETDCTCNRMEKHNGFYVTCCGKYTFVIEIRKRLWQFIGSATVLTYRHVMWTDKIHLSEI